MIFCRTFVHKTKAKKLNPMMLHNIAGYYNAEAARRSRAAERKSEKKDDPFRTTYGTSYYDSFEKAGKFNSLSPGRK